jgi:hypothetical protein
VVSLTLDRIAGACYSSVHGIPPRQGVDPTSLALQEESAMDFLMWSLLGVSALAYVTRRRELMVCAGLLVVVIVFAAQAAL